MGTPRRDVEAKAIMPAQAQSEQVQISFLQEKIKLTNGYAWWGYFIVLIGMFSMLYSMFVGIPFLILGIIYWMICYNAKST